MKYIQKTGTILFAFFVLLSCKKAGADNGAIKTPPANLVLNAIISTDGSGKVAFTATADNAVSYKYEFGDGNTSSLITGTTSHQYTLGGSNIFVVTVTAESSSGLVIKKTIQVTVTVIPPVPVLFWSEEFNTDGVPDTAKWGYDLGASGWGNAELEDYTSRPENVLVQGGVLKIHAIKENYNGSSYTSARLLTKDKFSFKYGKVEVRAKLPSGVGTWPAIWMLGSDIGTAGWPASGEIDIMEHLGRTLNTIYGTLHYPGHSGGSADGTTTVIANATTEFHIYSLEWSASAIKIFVDNQLYHTTANSNNLPFNHDFFFIVNVAMGGGFGGPVDPTFTKSTMEVDYIRVYK